MALVVGTNSYVNVVGADLYFTDRYQSPLWTTVPVSDKEPLLIAAATSLDHACVWLGSKHDPNQPMPFPRAPGDGTVPAAIIQAQLEIAYGILENGSASSSAGGDAPVSELKAGSVMLKFDTKAEASSCSSCPSIFNQLSKDLLSYFGTCNFGTGGTRIIPMELQ